ncbi:MAG: DedA family protein [Proteobacteria bacterium]|nr:DedA family protein [Pseudomonadota bacterium]
MEPLSWLVNFFTEFGYWAVFGVLIACGFGLPIPEDISLVAGGIISGLHFTKLSTMIVTGMAGVLIGDGIVFTIGRFFGQRVFSLPLISKLMTPDRFIMVQSKFTKYGNWVLFAARFMPGLRTPIFLTAGASRKVSFLRFFILDGAAALISVPVWVYLGYLGADNREWLMQMVKRGQTLTYGIIGLALIVAIIIFLVRRRTQKQCQT